MGPTRCTGALLAAFFAAALLLPRPVSAQGVFVRGDCDGSERLDITDAIRTLGYLFLGAAEPVCLDACDADDDESLNITDAIRVLGYLFLGGPPPNAPFPLAGPDSAGDALSCENGRFPVAELHVVPSRLVFHRTGATALARLRAVLLDGTDTVLDGAGQVLWSVGDPAVAAVDGSGRVAAISVGHTVVRGTYLGVGAEAEVVVEQGADGGPRVVVIEPRNGAIIAGNAARIEGRTFEPGVEVEIERENGGDGGPPESIHVERSGRDGLAFAAHATLGPGANTFRIRASRSGRATEMTLTVRSVDPSTGGTGPDGRPFPRIPPRLIDPPDRTAPVIEIAAPRSGEKLISGIVSVRGFVDDPLADVRVNGVPAIVEGGEFRVDRLALAPGVATIEVRATDPLGNEATAGVSVDVDDSAPALEIEDGGRDLFAASGAPFVLRGTVEPAGTPVTVNGRAADVSGAMFSISIPDLDDGFHDLVIEARSRENPVARASAVRAVHVSRIGPEIELLHPPPALLGAAPGFATSASSVALVGRVSDFGVPIDLGSPVTVSANGAETVASATGLFRIEVPLAFGTQSISLVARSARGTESQVTIGVERTAASPRIEIVRGDGDLVAAGTTHSTALQVRVIDASARPVSNAALELRVAAGAGAFLPSGARAITLETSATGEASVPFRAGDDAASAADVVVVTSPSVPRGACAFVLGARPDATRSLVHLGSSDRLGAAGVPLARSLEARLLDGRGNSVAGESVTFRIVSGPGELGPGGRSLDVSTGESGIARADVLLPGDLDSALTVEASSGDAVPIRFHVRGLVPGPAADTALAGVVTDDLHRPIAGATVRVIGAPGVVATTGAGGGFRAVPVPYGDVLLEVDAAPLAGARRFRVTAIRGRTTALPQPLSVVRSSMSDRSRTVRIADTQNAILTLGSVPGLRIDLPPGSVRFGDGSGTGTVTLALPNARGAGDALPDGLSGDGWIVIEPPDLRFLPLARAALPVAFARPGAVAPVYRRVPGAGGWCAIGRGIVDDEGIAARTPRLGGGAWLASRRGPPVGSTATITGRIALPLGGVTEVPQRDGSAVVAHQVYAHSGELFLDETDLWIRGRGIDYRFRRRYESRHLFRGSLGWNWEHEYADRRLLPVPGSENLARANGRGELVEYLYDREDDRYVAPIGVYSRLFRERDGSLVEREPDGTRYRYRPFDESPLAGRLVSITDRNRNTLYIEHDARGRIERVIDTLGRSIDYQLDGAGRIVSVTDFAGRVLRFEYDAAGDLVAVTHPSVTGTVTGNDFPAGKRTEYRYRSISTDARLEHNLAEIIDPLEVSLGTRRPRLRIHYREDPDAPDCDRVIAQEVAGMSGEGDAALGEIAIRYEFLPQSLDDGSAEALAFRLVSPAVSTEWIDPEGAVHEVLSSGAGLPLRVRTYSHDADGPRVTDSLRPPPGVDPPFWEERYRYSADGLLLEHHRAGGARTVYEYDVDAPLRSMRGRPVREVTWPAPAPGDDPPPIVTDRRFDPIFGREVFRRGPYFLGGAPPAPWRAVLDYQEGENVEALALELGVRPDEAAAAIEHAGTELGLGDLDSDGATLSRRGNTVQEILLPVMGRSGGLEGGGGVEGNASIREFRFDAFGQLVWERDAVGTVTRFEYFPERDPDGDGVVTATGVPLDPSSGGFLRRVTRDADGAAGGAPLALETRLRYDELGRTTEVTDPMGATTRFTFNALDQVVELRAPDPLRYRRWCIWDANDRLSEIRVENVSQSEAGNVVPVTSNPVIETSFEHDLAGRLTRTTREVSGGDVGPVRKIVETFARDRRGELVGRSVSYEGASPDEVIEWKRDARGLVIARTVGPGSSEAASTTFSYDAGGALVLEVDAADTDGDGDREAIERRYDAFGRLASVVDALGSTRVYERDAAGRVVAEALIGGGDSDGAALLERSSTERDLRGLEIRHVRLLFGDGDPARELVEAFAYDAEGRLVSETGPDGLVRRLERDALGRVIAETTPGGVRIERDLDGRGNTVVERRLETIPEIFDASRSGQPGFDSDGRLVREERRAYVYDALGRVVASVDPRGGVWRLRWNSQDRPILVTDAAGTTIGATAAPDIASIRDRLTPLQAAAINGHGNRVHYLFDGVGRLAGVEHELRRGGEGGGAIDLSHPFVPDGVVELAIERDARGRITAWRDDAGRRTRVEYDRAGYVRKKTWPDGSVETREVDRDGFLRALVDRNGSRIEEDRDALGRVIERRIDPAEGLEGTEWQAFAWDALSRPVFLADGNDPDDHGDDTWIAREYDSLGRMMAETQSGFRLDYFYDVRDRRVALRHPDGRLISTSRDASGSVVELADESTLYAIFSRAPSGLIVDARFSNGLETSFARMEPGGVPSLGAYDPSGRVVELRWTVGGSTLLGYEYGRESNGLPLFERMLHRTGSPGDVWRYDSLYRMRRFLPEVVDPRVPPVDPVRKTDITYDANHNWRVLEIDQGLRRIEVDAVDRYTSIDGDPLAWDAAGNLLSLGNRRLVHDALGRPVRIIDRGVDVARFTWDADGALEVDSLRRGRRVTRAVLEASNGSPAGVYRAIWDGSSLAEERDGDGQLLSEWLRAGESIPGVFLRHAGLASDTYYLAHDARGNVTGAFGSSGALAEEVRYGPFGKPVFFNRFGNPVSSPPSGNTLLLGASPYDVATGLIGFADRVFVPEVGRFASTRTPTVPTDALARNGYVAPGVPGIPGRFPGSGLPRIDDRMIDRAMDATAIEPRSPAPSRDAGLAERFLPLLPRELLRSNAPVFSVSSSEAEKGPVERSTDGREEDRR